MSRVVVPRNPRVPKHCAPARRIWARRSDAERRRRLSGARAGLRFGLSREAIAALRWTISKYLLTYARRARRVHRPDCPRTKPDRESRDVTAAETSSRSP